MELPGVRNKLHADPD